MEADVLPFAARLVAAPDAGIALRAGPSVEREDEGTGVVAVVGHDFAHVAHAVEAEAVAPSHPGYVGFEHTYAGIAHLLDNVALQQCFNALLGVQVALRPQTDFYAFAAGVVAKFLQVLNVAVERGRLAVACAVAVVGQEPAERHVVGEIAVDGGAGRELVVLLFAVEALLDASVVLLALVVALAVLVEHEAVFGLLPVVAVVGVEVAFVETELGQEHGVARELIEVVEQCHGFAVDHDEGVEVVLLMRENDLAALGGAEVVAAGLEGVPHHAVALGAPIERRGRCHTAVHPVVGVFNGNGLALVAEAAVLHTTAVEVFASMGAEGECGAVVVEGDGLETLNHHVACFLVRHGEAARLFVDAQECACRGYLDVAAVVLEAHFLRGAAGVGHEDVGMWVGLRVTHDAAVVVAEEAENVFAVEVDSQSLTVGVDDLDGRAIQLLRLADAALCGLANALCQREGLHGGRTHRECGQCQRHSHHEGSTFLAFLHDRCVDVVNIRVKVASPVP